MYMLSLMKKCLCIECAIIHEDLKSIFNFINRLCKINMELVFNLESFSVKQTDYCSFSEILLSYHKCRTH